MDAVQRLEDTRKPLIARGRRMVALAERERRDFTPAEKSQFDQNLAEIARINRDIRDVREEDDRAREKRDRETSHRHLMEAIRLNPNEAWRTAVHEAGHATAAILEGYGIESLRLKVVREPYKSPRLAGGGCTPKRGGSPFVWLAGAAAELAEFGSHGPDWETRFSSDLARCEGHVSRGYRFPMNSRSSALQGLPDAKRRIRQKWPAVKALALALVARGVLPGPEAEKICLDALGDEGRELRKRLDHLEYQCKRLTEPRVG